MMRRLLPLALLVLLVAPAFAVRHVHTPKAPKIHHQKVHRQKHHKVNFKKVFPAGLESVLQENIEGDKIQAWRYNDQDEMNAAIQRGELVYLEHLYISPKLPENRRYARPATVAFIQELSVEFMDEFGDTKHFVPLTIDSAVRPMDVQIKLRKRLGCRWHSCVAAPADGERASSHERGTTIDISRRMSKNQLHWLIMRLLWYKASNKILVIEERACFHIFVYNGEVETIPSVIDGEIPYEGTDRDNSEGPAQPGSGPGAAPGDVQPGPDSPDPYPFPL